MRKKIDSDKITLNKLFEDFWFLIPEYQRPYVWTSDNINDLLEDLWFAYENNLEDEYFVGSLVLKKVVQSSFNEYEVLDGQQRLTTFALMLRILKDKTSEKDTKEAIEQSLFQKAIRVKRIPEMPRIVYKIRGDSDKFLRGFVLENKIVQSNKDISVRNMRDAVQTIDKFFSDKEDKIEGFIDFIFNNVVFIYVATEDFDDAFRLFTILNTRGIPLTNADILKAINIGEIEKSESKEMAEKYAKKWEDIQNELGEDFDRFLGFIRTILLKEKARKSLLEEFEEKIYKEKKLTKGKETVDILEEYYTIYTKIIDFSPNNEPLSEKSAQENNAYKNLITIMKIALPSTDWIPPLLHFYKKFGDELLLEFLKKLEFKFSSDWILYFTPTQRIENMNRIIKKIDKTDTPKEVLEDLDVFKIEVSELKNTLSGNGYGKRFVKYVLLKYEYLMQDNSQFIGNYSRISIEHILPQNPPKSSKWREWFSEEEIEEYKHKLGNLVLLNRRKNSSLSNLDFDLKKERYFKGSISTFPSINHIMRKTEWRKEDIENRTKDMIEKLTGLLR
ncbi:DUF262 domain-containing protein [Thermodesulfatator autotrophicus]|uniref:DUF262 domain-containing protein n=1 Tax=Thermodesulfatator autotrophicus TaxID=1795632 RepID=UPI00083842C1|nr:DUF262 domain-containing protein [Thermodesulfatator autotrophicus]